MSRNIQSVTCRIGDKDIIIETGRVATQAAGAVTVRCGDTVAFVAVAVGGKGQQDFFPLSVDYREKFYAAGKIPGGFFKREGRPTTKETLVSRLMDRPLRPLFPEGYNNEIAISGLALSSDQQNDPDVLAMIGGSAAIALSPVPFAGPLGAVRVGRINGKFIANPTTTDLETSDLELVMAASEQAIVMVEAGAQELPEKDMLDALAFGWESCKELARAQRKLAQLAGAPKEEFVFQGPDAALIKRIKDQYYQPLYQANQTPGKAQRAQAMRKVAEQIKEQYTAEGAAEPVDPKVLGGIIEDLKRQVNRDLILSGRRNDSRGPEDIRPIAIEMDILPRTHGSALFTRGETQGLVAIALGTKMDEQKIDGLLPAVYDRFMLHYNFPAFCVGEAWPNRGPKRREIGHGALAKRALKAVWPDKERFPYTVQVVSDIMESNGSSSMATVCGGSLALMAAGVPIKAAVAGIAMGLVGEGGKVRVLSDINGSEDHDGDMDFKVAGTAAGITALQMDIKIEGLSFEILSAALDQARRGRLRVLETMNAVLAAPRPDISQYAPRLETIKIHPEKIGLVIGPGGKNIKKLQADTGATVEIEDDGTVIISGVDGAGVLACKQLILAQTAEVERGAIYKGRVTSIKDFGAFVEVLPGQEGLVHISELSDGYVERVSDCVHVGDELEVKVIDIDAQNRIRLSRKAILTGGNGADEYSRAQTPTDQGSGDGGRRPEGGRGRRPDDGGGRGRRNDEGGDRGRRPEGDGRGRRPEGVGGGGRHQRG